MSTTERTAGSSAGTNRPAYDEVNVGDELPPYSVDVERATLVRYAGASGDFNPIHWNQRFALEVGLPDVIAHGMFTMGSAAELVTRWADDPGAVVSYSARFTKPVVVPDPGTATITITGVIGGKDDEARTVRVDLKATSGDETVLGRSQAVVRLK